MSLSDVAVCCTIVLVAGTISLVVFFVSKISVFLEKGQKENSVGHYECGFQGDARNFVMVNSQSGIIIKYIIMELLLIVMLVFVVFSLTSNQGELLELLSKFTCVVLLFFC
jgi:NADH:ubiquinone oxidoreductase subunit 3 (subunit A)